MQVTDDRTLDLRNFSTDHPVPRQKRQGRRIVAEQQNPLVGTHRRKRGSHLSEMFFPQFSQPARSSGSMSAANTGSANNVDVQFNTT